MGVVLQAQQRMFRVIEDTLLDAQFSPGGATDGRLSRGCIFDRETGTDVTDGNCLDVSCNVTTMQMISLQLLFSYISRNMMCIKFTLFKNSNNGPGQLKKHVLELLLTLLNDYPSLMQPVINLVKVMVLFALYKRV